MKRKTSLAVIEKNKPVLRRIEELKKEHPFWGYRRIWAHLVYADQMIVNKKRIYNLMRKNSLLVNKETRLRAKRMALRPKPRAKKPNEIWGIDMSKIKTEIGWVYIVIVLDWYSKKIVGKQVGLVSKTEDWLIALEEGLCKQYPEGALGKELKLVSDNGCQPTSTRFMKSCNTLGIKQIFTSYNNPKGNADTERAIRTMKEELFWLKEWQGVKQVEDALNDWVERYNETYLHSSLGYKPPVWVETNFNKQEVA
jgi:putative transposase